MDTGKESETPDYSEFRSEEFYPKNEGHAILREIMQDVERKNRRDYAIQILNRAVKYVHGYLTDYDIRVKRDYRGEPLKVIIEVWTDLGISKSEGDKK